MAQYYNVFYIFAFIITIFMEEDIKVDTRNKNGFKKLFDAFYVPLCLFAERYVEDPDVAADVVQDCFIRLWQRREDFTYLYQIKSFLYTSIRNQALNELEHRKVVDSYNNKVLLRSSEAFFTDHLIEEESYRMLQNSIAKLPQQTRNVIVLALDGMSNKEIAEELAVSDGTVHTLKKVAYKRLREDLKDYFYVALALFSSVNL